MMLHNLLINLKTIKCLSLETEIGPHRSLCIIVIPAKSAKDVHLDAGVKCICIFIWRTFSKSKMPKCAVGIRNS